MKYTILYIPLIALFGLGCSDFLELKPNQKMAVPHTLDHADLLLNDYTTLNTNYPSLGEVASDDYYLNDADWNGLTQEDERSTYTWSSQIISMTTQWQNPFKAVYLANQVLEILDKVDRKEDEAKYRKVWGGAHFYRAFAFHQVVSTFTLPYNSTTAKNEMGIPLRLNPALDYKSVRSTLEESYQQIISDYKVAISHLMDREPLTGRPSKAAAYAGLARVYLDMQDYEKAYHYADSSLQINNVLLDYHDHNPSASYPFERFNEEVLFPAITVLSDAISLYYGRIDPDLYASYDMHDLRKGLYFTENTDNEVTYGFKGSYDNTNGFSFVGLTTSEVYLIKAETAIRIGKVIEALSSINTLLKNRIDEDYFTPIAESEPEALLRLILDERRKELLFRGRRWSDLKRLNQDDRFKKTLTRTLDGKVYSLEPNSLKYAHLLPDLVITESGMSQNKR